MKPYRHFYTVVLLILALSGVQVVQASPLHDHSTHVVDCGVCHFSASEATVDDSPVTSISVTPAQFTIARAIQVTNNRTRLAYQGRAPPSFSS